MLGFIIRNNSQSNLRAAQAAAEVLRTDMRRLAALTGENVGLNMPGKDASMFEQALDRHVMTLGNRQGLIDGLHLLARRFDRDARVVVGGVAQDPSDALR